VRSARRKRHPRIYIHVHGVNMCNHSEHIIAHSYLPLTRACVHASSRKQRKETRDSRVGLARGENVYANSREYRRLIRKNTRYSRVALLHAFLLVMQQRPGARDACRCEKREICFIVCYAMLRHRVPGRTPEILRRFRRKLTIDWKITILRTGNGAAGSSDCANFALKDIPMNLSSIYR